MKRFNNASGLCSLVLFSLILVLFGCAKQYSETGMSRGDIQDLKIQDSVAIDGKTPIEISLEGGGFYGGANPVVVNKYVINGNGDIFVRRRQLYSGEGTSKHRVPKEYVTKLARFIIENGFLEMKDIYDCSDFNPECEQRKSHYPPAVPLTLTVTVGNAVKRVTVTVFEREMIDYPENLDTIVDRIYEVVRLAQE